MSEAEHRYLIGLGGNVRHIRYGAPRKVIVAALRRLDGEGLALVSASPIVRSSPIGPSRRAYANAAAIVATSLAPPAMLAHLKRIERDFDRKARGQRWAARTLDLDIVLWSGGAFADDTLVVPHREFRCRDFVLGPAAAIAPDWRDPLGGLSLRQHLFRLRAPRCLTSAMPLPR